MSNANLILLNQGHFTACLFCGIYQRKCSGVNRDTLAVIQRTYYTDEMTCARRIHFGTVLRNIADDVYLALDETEQEVLKRFHGCSHILISFMIEQRRKDTIRGKDTFINFKTLNTLSKYHASQQEEGVPS